MADEGHNPLLRPDRTRCRAGQIRPFVLVFLFLSVLVVVLLVCGGGGADAGDGERYGVGRAHGRDRRRIRSHGGVQAVRVLPVCVFLCLSQ